MAKAVGSLGKTWKTGHLVGGIQPKEENDWRPVTFLAFPKNSLDVIKKKWFHIQLSLPFTFRENWLPFTFMLFSPFPISCLFSGYLVLWDPSLSLFHWLLSSAISEFACLCHFPRIKEVKLTNAYFGRKEKKEKQTWRFGSTDGQALLV